MSRAIQGAEIPDPVGANRAGRHNTICIDDLPARWSEQDLAFVFSTQPGYKKLYIYLGFGSDQQTCHIVFQSHSLAAYALSSLTHNQRSNITTLELQKHLETHPPRYITSQDMMVGGFVQQTPQQLGVHHKDSVQASSSVRGKPPTDHVLKQSDLGQQLNLPTFRHLHSRGTTESMPWPGKEQDPLQQQVINTAMAEQHLLQELYENSLQQTTSTSTLPWYPPPQPDNGIAAMTTSEKTVTFISLDGIVNRKTNLPLRLSIEKHDSTDLIISTIKKNFYKNDDTVKARFEDARGNTLTPSYEILTGGSTVYVRSLRIPSQPIVLFNDLGSHNSTATLSGLGGFSSMDQKASPRKNYACPYYKHDNKRYSNLNETEFHYRRCAQSSWPMVSQVKQHLFRVHKQTLHCNRCFLIFAREESLRQHIKDTSCSSQPSPHPEKSDLVTERQIRKNRRRKPESEIWFEIFDILFPGAPRPSSPYMNLPRHEGIEKASDDRHYSGYPPQFFPLLPPLAPAAPLRRFPPHSFPPRYPGMNVFDAKVSEMRNFPPTSLNTCLPSDSGYHSGVVTDTTSVCSRGSMGSSLGVSPDFLGKFIELFGDIIIEHSGAAVWIEHALAHHSPTEIERYVNAALRNYVIDIYRSSTPGNSGDNSHHFWKALKLIRRYRPKIAQYFRTATTSVKSHPPKPVALRLHELCAHLTLEERVNLLDRKMGKQAGTNAHGEDLEMEEEEEDVDDEYDDDNYEDHEGTLDMDLGLVAELLTSGTEFKGLVNTLRNDLCGHDSAVAKHIAFVISTGLAEADRHNSRTALSESSEQQHRDLALQTATFEVEWNWRCFLTSQFGADTPQIGSVITLTGSAFYAQASTCSEFVQSTWPKSGPALLKGLQALVSAYYTRSGPETTEIQSDLTDNAKVHLSFHRISTDSDSDSLLVVQAQGLEETLIEVGQQLAWIGSSLNSSGNAETLMYSRATIAYQIQHNALFHLGVKYEPLLATENPCWLPLFQGSCIAKGFPIAERGNEVGLEIPLEIMAATAGARHAIEYEGGVVIKGFSTMLLPTKRTDDRVQWHLIASADSESRLSYQNGLESCRQRALLDTVDMDSMRSTRAIVGWCGSAVSLLGSDLAVYDNIDYSGADEPGREVKFGGGAIGFQQFGVAELNFHLGPKDGKCHFRRAGPYERIVSCADKAPVVLYDTIDQRGWLVSACEVILHIIQHRNRLEPCEVDGQPVKVPGTTLQTFAREVLRKNAGIKLSHFENYTVRDMVLNIWSILEFLLDQNSARDKSAGATIKSSRERLYGFDFMAVTEERSPMRRKQVYLQNSHGGWPCLVRDVDALVLLGKGFGDLIQPIKDVDSIAKLCCRWRELPKWRDYLGASVRCLQDFYTTSGCRDDLKYLTPSGLQWHRARSLLFESCPSSQPYRCKCDRLQQILPKSVIGEVVPPGPLSETGAVIFGQSECRLKETLFGPLGVKRKGIFGQANVSFVHGGDDVQTIDDTILEDMPDGSSSTQLSHIRTGSSQSASAPTSMTSQEDIVSDMTDVQLTSKPLKSRRLWRRVSSMARI